ncbi:glycosyltransferase family 2 protein [Thiohalocapsa marina]|uniref:Glycosyltransferase family 2 protein n=1 Tax=Thiohalocapsa marina TaxID=424902 RepID=A0A5M8FLG6_9GAMM|nr:glycosyltransferase family 2 protein [Thiohalocapsa marina]KAA6183295.1 glycosyltransferase family 2 protein [Thiohalocapsa marina]
MNQEDNFHSRLGTPSISLVVPVLNEAHLVAGFVDVVRVELATRGWRYEILFVNDGSTDGTQDEILAQAVCDSRVRLINLSRRFGKEAALSAGLRYALGEVVIPIDVDLQDPPALIPVFVDRWREGYDVVYGERVTRYGDGWFKRVSACLFYKLFNWLSPTHIPENSGDFRLLDRRVVDTINQLHERSRFMKGLFAWVGYRSIGVRFERPSRASGTSKWSNWRLWNFALDGLLSFSTVPLRIWSYVGATAALLAFTYGSFIIIRTLVFGVDLPGYASLLTTVLFLGGIQLLSVGILGEYLGRVMMETKARPLFIVESLQGGPGLASDVQQRSVERTP